MKFRIWLTLGLVVSCSHENDDALRVKEQALRSKREGILAKHEAQLQQAAQARLAADRSALFVERFRICDEDHQDLRLHINLGIAGYWLDRPDYAAKSHAGEDLVERERRLSSGLSAELGDLQDRYCKVAISPSGYTGLTLSLTRDKMRGEFDALEARRTREQPNGGGKLLAEYRKLVESVRSRVDRP